MGHDRASRNIGPLIVAALWQATQTAGNVLTRINT